MLLLFLILGFAAADAANNSYNDRNRKSINARKRRNERMRKRDAAWKRYDEGCGHDVAWFW